MPVKWSIYYYHEKEKKSDYIQIMARDYQEAEKIGLAQLQNYHKKADIQILDCSII